MCIECNGEQHYKCITFGSKNEEKVLNDFVILQKCDAIKIAYCKDNNIKLLIISYLDFKNIEEILKMELELNDKYYHNPIRD